jgi:hypothetical protein
MNVPASDTEDSWSYFGLWSTKKALQVSDLLRSLAVEFYTTRREETETLLKEWEAWDAASPNPHEGYDLWIRRRDFSTVGDHIVETFPERKFGWIDATRKPTNQGQDGV